MFLTIQALFFVKIELYIIRQHKSAYTPKGVEFFVHDWDNQREGCELHLQLQKVFMTKEKVFWTNQNGYQNSEFYADFKLQT